VTMASCCPCFMWAMGWYLRAQLLKLWLSQVGSTFERRALGEPKDSRGIKINQELAVGTITVSQENKALALATQLGVTGYRRALRLSQETYAGLRTAQPREPMADKLILAAYSEKPLEGQHAALLDIEMYVGSTAAWGITYGGKRWSLGFFAMQTLQRARTHGGAPQVGSSPDMEEPSRGAARSGPPRSLNDGRRVPSL
jgi:hypothetical protein